MKLPIEKDGENLKTIRFEGELLPKWAHLLDVAARLAPVPEITRSWFSNFTRATGVDDARTAAEYCRLLHAALEKRDDHIRSELSDSRSVKILQAWKYALTTMIQQTGGKGTCSWTVEGAEPEPGFDDEGGDISLRRVD